MSYLRFVERPHPNKAAKTRCWEVRSERHGDLLGSIAWFSRWRQYTFRTIHNVVLNPDCLREIADFAAARTQDHRIKAQP